MIDVIARGMAANKGGGTGGESYTKEETDALLDLKQDKLDDERLIYRRQEEESEEEEQQEEGQGE